MGCPGLRSEVLKDDQGAVFSDFSIFPGENSIMKLLFYWPVSSVKLSVPCGSFFLMSLRKYLLFQILRKPCWEIRIKEKYVFLL